MGYLTVRPIVRGAYCPIAKAFEREEATSNTICHINGVIYTGILAIYEIKSKQESKK